MMKRPSHLYQLIQNEEWLRSFCTYKQERAILHWGERHREQWPIKIEIEEGDDKQNFVTLYFEGDSKITF